MNRQIIQEDEYSDIEQQENVPANAEAEPVAAAPVAKKRWGGFSYKNDKLVEDPTGMRNIFSTFTMEPKTVDSLRGKGHDLSDLNKIVSHYRAWHISHCPKLEYYFFLEKVQKMGKDKEVEAYLSKLRNHYKGEEILEEF